MTVLVIGANLDSIYIIVRLVIFSWTVELLKELEKELAEIDDQFPHEAPG